MERERKLEVRGGHLAQCACMFTIEQLRRYRLALRMPPHSPNAQCITHNAQREHAKFGTNTRTTAQTQFPAEKWEGLNEG